MSKELEALEKGIIEFEKDLEDDCNNEWLKRVVAGMKKCYQRLESIENANPSEALEETLRDIAYDLENDDNPFLRDRYYGLLDVKQSLLKAQEQEKVLKILFEKNVDLPYLYELFECIKQGKDTIESALKQYNDSARNGVNAHHLTQEEFDLLKRYFGKIIQK